MSQAHEELEVCKTLGIKVYLYFDDLRGRLYRVDLHTFETWAFVIKKKKLPKWMKYSETQWSMRNWVDAMYL